METILYRAEANEIFDYEDLISWLKFKIRELENLGMTTEEIMNWFPDSDFVGNIERIHRLIMNILLQIKSEGDIN